MKNVFINGAINAKFIGETIQAYQSKTSIGAHQIFLGQVRADNIDSQTVTAIEYSAYEDMANQKFEEIRLDASKKYDLKSTEIFHSIGNVKAGEICLFVLVAAGHRKTVFEALEYVVERIKKEVPVFGKEILEDTSHVWKVNK